jgi:alkylation response protein AidB-like acyl-CoA dehydrogenase
MDRLSSETLIARASQLGSLLASEAAQGEKDRRLTEKAVRALTEADLFQLGIPRRYGGQQSDVRTMLEVGAMLGEADGAAAWVVTLCNACSWVVSLFPQRAQDDVFGADPMAKVSGALAPTAWATRARDGYRITGKWSYNSGLLHADWTLLGMPAGESGEHGMALVPTADLRIEETWFVAGMKGTGSNSAVVEDLFVPDHRIMTMSSAMDAVSVFAPLLTLILAAPQLGMGRAALRMVREAATSKSVTGTDYRRQADSVAFQLQLAEAALKIDTAHLHSYRASADIDAQLTGGEPLSRLVRARVRADTGWAVHNVVSAIDTLVSAHGSASFAESHPLQRIWRDSNIALRHAMALPVVNYEIYGKELLDITPNISAMV